MPVEQDDASLDDDRAGEPGADGLSPGDPRPLGAPASRPAAGRYRRHCARGRGTEASPLPRPLPRNAHMTEASTTRRRMKGNTYHPAACAGTALFDSLLTQCFPVCIARITTTATGPPGRTARAEGLKARTRNQPKRMQPRRNYGGVFCCTNPEPELELDNYGLFKTRRTDSRGRAGPRERRGADGRLHEPGGLGHHAPHRLRDVLQPHAQHAVDQGRDLGQPARRPRHPRSTATRTRCS